MSKTDFIAEPGKQVVVIKHVFDAPRERVWKLYTDPKHLPDWWGPRALTTKVEKMDVKPGGMWRVIQRDAKGEEFGFHGVYHDVQPPKRIVYTFEFEGMPGHFSVETVVFEEKDGKTMVTDTVLFQSVEDRDGMVQTGMEVGTRESMERFDELLARAE
jgi:uncharacterized protein YndB with AHSA1/START domain